jgi:hypothetical protein
MEDDSLHNLIMSYFLKFTQNYMVKFIIQKSIKTTHTQKQKNNDSTTSITHETSQCIKTICGEDKLSRCRTNNPKQQLISIKD